ncbi:branched-chain amino acid ABC transporter permease [Mesorhizobium sp. INR15]|uniref:branched-chain amino acid ABC transporter permease n=1 Tax=Mesorhizobium sp. INR15 TaxID=2654248 RepID=UPI0018966416|nr:branched-chain amino acid ABC transporter permease [Mesorhizobium sp. INR15]
MAAISMNSPWPPLRWFGLLAGVVILLTLPLWSPSDYITSIATLAIFFAVASTGLNVVYGYAGLLSFAQVGFWGLGAYVSALLVTDHGFSPWTAIACAGVVCVITSLAGGLAALRVSRDAFVVITLSFSLLLQLLARSWTSLTRGAMGIPGLPSPRILAGDTVLLDGNTASGFYWIALGCGALVIAATWWLLRSRIGRAFIAVNLDENLARSQGISVFLHQLSAFALSALIGGLAGALYVFKLGIVDPGIFDIYYAQMMLIIVIVGGAGHFWFVLLMSFVFTALPELLRLAPELRMILFGLVLIITIQFMPQGLGGYLADRRNRMLRRTE